MLKGTNIQEGSGEFIIKSYHASKFRSQHSNVRSDGYLYITNQRVIFRAIASDSVIHSEIPIENVAGINMYHGEYRDWFKLLQFFLLILGLAIPVWGIFGASFLFGVGTSNELGISSTLWGIGLLTLVVVLASFKFNTLEEPFINLSLFTRAFLSTLSSSVFFLLIPTMPIAALFCLVAIVITIIAINSIPRKFSMSLAIVSKGGSSTPIMIAGANSNGMVFSAAAQALEAEPGADASKLVEELGAIIHDIQTLGTLGVERWMKNTPIFSSSSDTPPSDTPPSDTPPSDTPPSDTPPSDTPPSDTPPTNQYW